ncbi:MAG: STAS domain-containing protein [Treponema sp.]|nr:STAS domain-containing protein [Treponema sp.]
MINNDIVPGFDTAKDESLVIKLQKVPNVNSCLILILEGYINTGNTGFFQQRIQKAIETGYTRLIFNCNSLNYVSSTGIGCFSAFLKALKPIGGDLILLEIQPKVYEVFQLLGFSQLFNIMKSLDDSIDFFRGSTAKPNTIEFPRIFSCSICSKKLKVLQPGRFRCPECKTILNIDNTGLVS